MLIIQTLHITVEHEPVKIYDSGLCAAPAFFLLILAICIRKLVLIFGESDYRSFGLFIVDDALQVAAAVVSFIACLSLPRRPSVYEKDHIIDGQYTVSAFSSYTFGFAGKVLSLARNKKSLELADLPKLHLWGRSSFLLNYFGSATTKNDRLWKSVIYAHYPELLFQTAWAILQSALQFAPQLAMYHLLKLLEQRAEGAAVENEAWGLVVALGAAIILASWTQAWEHWIVWARLGQPMRTELSAMIFSKSLRRKDVKGVGKAKDAQTSGSNGTLINADDPGGANQTDPLLGEEVDNASTQTAKDTTQDGGDEDMQKTRQSTINLVVSQ